MYVPRGERADLGSGNSTSFGNGSQFIVWGLRYYSNTRKSSALFYSCITPMMENVRKTTRKFSTTLSLSSS